MGDITKGITWTSGDTVTAAKLNNHVDDATINALAVTTAKLADGAVTTAKIADGAVTFGKIAAAALAAMGVNAWSVKTGNYTLVAGDRILADSSGGTFTLTLPATPAANDAVTLVDPANSWKTTNLTVARNGSTIEGAAEDLTLDYAGVLIVLIYTGTTWRIYT